jgi:hypothetical protein
MKLRMLVVGFVLFALMQSVYASSNPVPFIGQPLAPTSAKPGTHGLTLTVGGTGFVSGSAVQWNGQALPTVFVSGQSLSATVPASDLVKPGSALIKIVNFAPGGGASNFVTFDVTWSTPSVIQFEIRTSTPSPTNSIATGDFNGDGKLDVAASTGSTLSILLGNGDGTFSVTTYSTTAQFVGTLVVGDFNGDGKLDIAFPDPSNNLLHMLLGNGDGTFTEVSTTPVGANPVWTVAGDFNGDGRLDIAVVNEAGRNVSILLGNGDGTFSRKPSVEVGTAPNAIVTADLNGDGILDLAVVNTGNSNVSILLGNGDGTFTLKSSPAVGSSAFGIVASDFNGDGKIDLAVTNTCGSKPGCAHPADGSLSILIGAGDGTFSSKFVEMTDYSGPRGIAAGDFNADGKMDLAVVGLNESSALIFPGNGKGGFGTPIPITGFGPPRAGYVAVGDFNGDGRLDFVENNPNAIDGVFGVSVQAQSAVAFYPHVLSFAPQSVGTRSGAKNMKFQNVGVAPVNISQVGVYGYYTGTNNCPATLAVGEHCNVSVSFAPQFVGRTGGEVYVYDDALGGLQAGFLAGTGK